MNGVDGQGMVLLPRFEVEASNGSEGDSLVSVDLGAR